MRLLKAVISVKSADSNQLLTAEHFFQVLLLSKTPTRNVLAKHERSWIIQ